LAAKNSAPYLFGFPSSFLTVLLIAQRLDAADGERMTQPLRFRELKNFL